MSNISFYFVGDLYKYILIFYICRSIKSVTDVFMEMMYHVYGKTTRVSYEEKCIAQFHSSLHDDDQKRLSEEFSSSDSKIRCIVATVAFGLGMDIKDIELVIHWGESDSVLAYWQEVGRAGRNAKPAEAHLYHRGEAIRTADDQMKSLVTKAKNSTIKCWRRDVLNELFIKGMSPMPVAPPPCTSGGRQRCGEWLCCYLCRARCTCPEK